MSQVHFSFCWIIGWSTSKPLYFKDSKTHEKESELSDLDRFEVILMLLKLSQRQTCVILDKAKDEQKNIKMKI